MDRFPKDEFLRDFKIKTLVQQAQFEQWLKSLFYLNNELTKNWDFVYQEMFYIKLHETLMEGLVYAGKILQSLEKGNNENKREWYNSLIDGLIEIKSKFSEEEKDYIEYRRHNVCHIFQNSYEHIQENLRIKKFRREEDLQNINARLKQIIAKHGSDKNVDIFLNSKLQPKLTNLYIQLTKIHDKKYRPDN